MKIGFIGGGKMAEAIIADLVNSKTVNAADICVCDISEERLKILHEKYKLNVSTDLGTLLASSDTVFIAVKPQNLSEVLTDMAQHITNKHLVISIAAGKKIAIIEHLLPKTRVIRVMPNMAALVSEAMNVFCAGNYATKEDIETARTLLSCSGKALKLPEEQFDAVTAVSGSGPAFFTYFLAKIINAGEQLGLEHKTAETLATQTMLGTAKLLTKGGFNATDLIETISSAKGTTVAGMNVLKESALEQIIYDTLSAAAKRSTELSG